MAGDAPSGPVKAGVAANSKKNKTETKVSATIGRFKKKLGL